MSVSITYEENGGYIIISGEGQITADTIREFALPLMNAVNEHNCHKILEDYRKVDLKLGTLEIMVTQKFQMDFIKRTYKTPILLKRAMLTKDGPIDKGDLRFFETVNVNRGQFVKLFNDYDKAVEWLLEK
jgi:hypothetical protein